MAEYTNKDGALSSIQCIIFGLISAALLYLCWTRPIPVAMMSLDCLPALVFMLIELKTSLCSNHVFMGVLCNVIVVVLLVNSGSKGNSSESHEFYGEYLITYDALQVQIVGENEKERAVDDCEHCVDYMIECQEKAQKWSTEEYAREPEMDGGNSCNENCEDKSTWDSRLAIVFYPVEELNGRCDEFIANFRRDYAREPEMDGGDSCNDDCEEKSTWDLRLAIVQYQPVEELNRRCDDFIAYFRRQMSLQSCDN